MNKNKTKSKNYVKSPEEITREVIEESDFSEKTVQHTVKAFFEGLRYFMENAPIDGRSYAQLPVLGSARIKGEHLMFVLRNRVRHAKTKEEWDVYKYLLDKIIEEDDIGVKQRIPYCGVSESKRRKLPGILQVLEERSKK